MVIPRDERVAWVGLGVGATSAGFLAQIDGSSIKDGRVLRARLNIAGNDANWSGTTPTSISEFAVLAGRGRICCGAVNWGSYAIGGSILSGSKGSPTKAFTTVGLAGELLFVTGRSPHPSVALIANLNPQMPFVGVNVFMPFGRQPFVSAARPPRRR